MWYRPHSAIERETLGHKTSLGFLIRQKHFDRFHAEAQRLHPDHSAEENRAWAAYCARTHPDCRINIPLRIATFLFFMLIGIVIFAMYAQAEPAPHLATFHLNLTPIDISGGPASARLQVRDGSGVWQDVGLLGPSISLPVQCTSGCTAAASFADNSAFTGGSTSVSNISAVFNDGITSLTSGNAGALRSTTDRMLFVNVGKLGGTSLSGANVVDLGNTAFRVNCVVGCGTVSISGTVGVTQSTSPWVGNTTQWNSIALGSPSTYGTSPGAVNVPGVNAFITNTPPVSQSGTWTVQPGNTANTTAWKVDGSAVTQPVSGTVTANQGTANATPWNENISQIAGSVPAVTNPLPVRFTDGTGFISSSVIGGFRYIKNSMTQDIEVSASNSSTTNLAAAASFTGTSQTTLGVGAIQVVLFMDQNATVQVQQAQEDPGVNWNVVDSWTYTANSTGTDAARTIQAVASSVRTIVTNNGGSTTTALRLQTVVCPVCDTLPRGLTQLGNLKDGIIEVGGTAVSTAAAGVQKVGIVGNAGAAIDAANNAAVPANVIADGIETIAQGSQPTAATAGNMRRILGTTEGAVFVQQGSSNRFSCFVQAVTVTTECKAAPGAGLRAYIMSINFSNQAATVQTLDLVFGTGTNCATGTTALTHKFQFGTNATTTSPQEVASEFASPLVPTAANAICIRPGNATVFGATITGYIAP